MRSVWAGARWAGLPWAGSPPTITISPVGISVVSAFGDDAIVPGPISVSPPSTPVSVAFGIDSLMAGAVSILEAGFAASVVVGTVGIDVGFVSIGPQGVSGVPSLGSPGLSPGPVMVSPASFDAGTGLGIPSLTSTLRLSPAGIVSPLAFGDVDLAPGQLTLLPSSLTGTSFSFGVATIVEPGSIVLVFRDIRTLSASHVGDFGTILEVDIESPDGSPLDVSVATVLNLVFQKPDGTVMTATASPKTDGMDGIVQYAFADGDLDQTGTWRYQAFVHLGTAEVWSDVGKLKVLPNLPLES